MFYAIMTNIYTP